MSLPSEDVAEGIVSKWNATAALAPLVPGGLTREEATSEPDAEAGKLSPYAVFQVVPQETIWSAGGSRIDKQEVTLKLYGEFSKLAPAGKAAPTATAAFVRQSLTLGGSSSFLACLQMKPTEVKKTGKSTGGEDVWVATITLLVMSQQG